MPESNKIEHIKNKMLAWSDFYGGTIDTTVILNANTKEELNNIIEKHRQFLEDMARDADNHIDKFKQSIEL